MTATSDYVVVKWEDPVREDEDHSKCCWSTGIHDGLTVGQGEINVHGYWERPCYHCARKEEKKNPKFGPVWPFKDEGSDDGSN